jgi:hypothetical protein
MPGPLLKPPIEILNPEYSRIPGLRNHKMFAHRSSLLPNDLILLLWQARKKSEYSTVLRATSLHLYASKGCNHADSGASRFSLKSYPMQKSVQASLIFKMMA